MEEINKFYARIPNYFFYYNGEFLMEIGGRNSFVLYCLLTSRKNMANKTYITIRGINDVLKLGKNITRARKTIIELLELQKENELIKYKVDLDKLSNDEYVCIEWIDLFENNVGWTHFYPDDFDIHSKVGNIAYTVMWFLRMYVNNKTGTSYPSINNISKVLIADIVRVQNSINLFEEVGLFDITRGKHYHNKSLNKHIQGNNHYSYTGNIEELLNMDDSLIKDALNKNVNMQENKLEDKI